MRETEMDQFFWNVKHIDSGIIMNLRAPKIFGIEIWRNGKHGLKNALLNGLKRKLLKWIKT